MLKRIRQSIWRIKKRLFCYWCLDQKKYRLGKFMKHTPVDGDYSKEEDRVYPIYDDVCLCRGHLWDLQEGEGVYSQEY